MLHGSHKRCGGETNYSSRSLQRQTSPSVPTCCPLGGVAHLERRSLTQAHTGVRLDRVPQEGLTSVAMQGNASSGNGGVELPREHVAASCVSGRPGQLPEHFLLRSTGLLSSIACKAACRQESNSHVHSLHVHASTCMSNRRCYICQLLHKILPQFGLPQLLLLTQSASLFKICL